MTFEGFQQECSSIIERLLVLRSQLEQVEAWPTHLDKEEADTDLYLAIAAIEQSGMKG